MKKLITRYGLYSAVFLIVTGVVTFFAGGGANAGPESYGTGEVIGYLSIILSMVFVFIGIKKYRDETLIGSISFGKALKVGSLIVLFPAIAFAIYNVVYVEVMDPEFAEKYYEYQLEKAKANADPSEYEAIEISMEGQKAMFTNVPFQTVVMFFTVFIIGFIISLLSSLILSRGMPNKEPAEA